MTRKKKFAREAIQPFFIQTTSEDMGLSQLIKKEAMKITITEIEFRREPGVLLRETG